MTHALVWMTCQGGSYDQHSEGIAKWVPFVDAIHNAPKCHDLPMLTEGGRRMRDLAARWREHGPTLDCRFSSKGEGQGVSCYSHGWNGVYHDVHFRDGSEWRCPAYPIAAWLTRRAALRDEGETT